MSFSVPVFQSRVAHTLSIALGECLMSGSSYPMSVEVMDAARSYYNSIVNSSLSFTEQRDSIYRDLVIGTKLTLS